MGYRTYLGIIRLAEQYSAQRVEASAERKLGKSAYVLANAFWYSMHSAIEAVLLFRNVTASDRPQA